MSADACICSTCAVEQHSLHICVEQKTLQKMEYFNPTFLENDEKPCLFRWDAPVDTQQLFDGGKWDEIWMINIQTARECFTFCLHQNHLVIKLDNMRNRLRVICKLIIFLYNSCIVFFCSWKIAKITCFHGLNSLLTHMHVPHAHYSNNNLPVSKCDLWV